MVYRRMRIGAAQRELARDKSTRFLPPGYSYVSCQSWARRFNGTIQLVGAYFWHKDQDNIRWLAHNSTHGEYIVRLLDDPGPVKLTLSPTRYTAALGAVRGS